jgi:PAS domain-containing protein
MEFDVGDIVRRVDGEVIMPGHPIEIILLRELADHLSTAIFVVDPDGVLVFYNEPAENLLGRRYDETGSLALEEWSTLFQPTNGRGVPLPAEKLPLAISLAEQRPTQGRIWIQGLDGVRRRLEIAAIPLTGQWGDKLGAVAIFWEPQ